MLYRRLEIKNPKDTMNNSVNMFFVTNVIFLMCFVLVAPLQLRRRDVKLQDTGRSLSIVGGKNTSIVRHPYQVALLHGENEFLCSAAVLSKYWALTLGVCVFGVLPNNFVLRTSSDDALTGGSIYEVEKVVVHPKYNDTVDYDFALLRTKTPFKFGRKLKPIKLPLWEPKPGHRAVVSGWGWLNVSVPFTHVLLQVPSKVVSRRTCRRNYKGVYTARMICSYSKDSGPCYKSDWGSLLVSNNKLHGLYSWSMGCGGKTYPPVYTNVAAVKSWIIKTIKK